VGNAGGGRQQQDEWFVHNSLKVNKYLVKVEVGWTVGFKGAVCA